MASHETQVNVRFLVAAEDFSSTTTLLTCLERIGLPVDTVHHEGIAAAIAERVYAVVFIEADKFPIEFDLVRNVHDVKNSSSHPGVIGFIHFCQPETKKRCMDAGMTDVIEAPFHFDALYETVTSLSQLGNSSELVGSGNIPKCRFAESDAIYLRCIRGCVFDIRFPDQCPEQDHTLQTVVKKPRNCKFSQTIVGYPRSLGLHLCVECARRAMQFLDFNPDRRKGTVRPAAPCHLKPADFVKHRS